MKVKFAWVAEGEFEGDVTECEFNTPEEAVAYCHGACAGAGEYSGNLAVCCEYNTEDWPDNDDIKAAVAVALTYKRE